MKFSRIPAVKTQIGPGRGDSVTIYYSSDDVPVFAAGAEVVLGVQGEAFVRAGSELLQAGSLDRHLLRAVLRAVDGKKTIAAITAELAPSYAADEVLRVMNALAGIVLMKAETNPPSQLQVRGSVLVLGDGSLGASVRDSLRQAGIAGADLTMASSFASIGDPEFEATLAEIVFGGMPRGMAPPGPADRELSDIHPEQLTKLFRDRDLIVVVIERGRYRALLDVNRALIDSGTPGLFVTFEGATAVVGPWVLAHTTPCLACRVLSTHLRTSGSRAALARVLQYFGPGLKHEEDAVLHVIKEEVLAIMATPPAPRLLHTAVEIGPAGTRALRAERVPECTECGTGSPSAVTSRNLRARSLEVLALTELGTTLELAGQQTRFSSSESAPDGYRSVGILGGGTAGYLSALILKTRLPHLDVTLIESSKIPIIGVGEATTLQLVKFLHNPSLLCRDVVDFYRRVRPTWKLGIRFFWGLPGEYYFNYPFQYGPLLEPYLYEGSINTHCLASIMMSEDRSPVIHRGDGSFESLLSTVRFAYHLDNRRFVHYLQEEARKEGVRHIDAEIKDAALSPDGEDISYLVTEDGRRLEFDLYVDCSGFRSMLIDKKLRSPFLSYASSLFTDRAIAANAPNGGMVKPYTTAETMENGWCWNIPFEDSDHLGYVHASDFCSEDEALEEMRRKHPGLTDPWVVKFRSGRHEHFWKGNVVAVGNAYAFVEPLESTAIHMIVFELIHLTNHFPSSRRDQAVKALLNKKVNKVWDELRWFLSVHYKFNRKLSTRFWTEVHRSCDISGADERLQLFRERAPLSYKPSMFFYPPDFFTDDHALDVILLGQQLEGRHVTPTEDRETWARKTRVRRRLVEHALPQMKALELMYERPEMLGEFVSNPNSWVHLWITC